LIIEELLRRDESLSGKGRYFEGAPEIPGIIRCLGNTVDELRMAGVNQVDIDPRSFIVPEKGEGIKGLLGACEAHLAENKLIDQAGVITMAIQKLEDEFKQDRNRIVMVLSDFPMTGLEKRFVNLVAGNRLKVLEHSRPVGLDIPKRFFSGAHRNERDSSEPLADIDLLQWLRKPGEAPSPFGDGSVSLFHALGESNEVREAFRQILAMGFPLDSVEILVTKSDPYVPLIYEIASSLDILVTFAGGIPITYTRPGRLEEASAIMAERGFPLDHDDRPQLIFEALKRIPEGERTAGLIAARVLLDDEGHRTVIRSLLSTELYNADGPWHVLAREYLGSVEYNALLSELEAGGHGSVAEPEALYNSSPGKMTQRRLFD
jgi:hypothetical protein